MPEGICNKCGEHRELVLAGCACGSCSDSLDNQWANCQATDWVLIPTPAAHLENLEDRGRSSPIIDIMQALKESLLAAKAKGFHPGLFQLSSLTSISADAEFFSRYVYRNTTYAQMKLRWATCNPPDDLDIGRPEDEFAGLVSATWPKPGPAFIRPATSEEVADHEAMLRDRQRREIGRAHV